ncbi:hypothetical protein C4577_01160 [Candidatus Parcubacteria bacterium]|nr:MAG: hypothetical protein C4577_01160 [Candidatus Parcubacteria bacterium]
MRKICPVIFLLITFFFLKLQPVYAQSVQNYPVDNIINSTNTITPALPQIDNEQEVNQQTVPIYNYNNVVQAPTPLPEYTPPPDLHYRTQNVMIEVMSAFVCQIAGFDPVNPEGKCLGIDPEAKKIGFVENSGGMVGFAANLIGMTYKIPISSNQYFADLGSRFGIVKPAYAQGVGFKGLEPVMELWKVFRDVVYLLFVIIFVLVGLGIMFRIQIDARTVMSIQNQIPKIIVTLILITFSYAIVGILIDLMWLVMYFFFLLVQGTGINVMNLNPADAYGRTTFEVVNNSFGGIHGMASNVALSVKEIIGNIMNINTDPLQAIIPFNEFISSGQFAFDWNNFSFANWMIDTISLFAGFGVGAKVATMSDLGFVNAGPLTGFITGYATYAALETSLRWLIPYLITFLIVFVAILWALFRLWFQLLKSYVFILMDVIFAPFWIGAGLIPGVSTGFGSWIRDLLAHLSAFPTAIIMFMLGKAFMEVFAVKHQDPFLPPLIGNPGDPALFANIVGLGIILLTPEVVNMTRDAFKSPEMKYPAIIGKAIGVGQGASSAFTGGVGKQFWRTDNMGNPKGMLNTYLYSRFKGKTMLGTLFGNVLGGWREDPGESGGLLGRVFPIKRNQPQPRTGQPPTTQATGSQPAQNQQTLSRHERAQQQIARNQQNQGGNTNT